MLCWFCNKTKGKRACPARGGEGICSRCCGTKRRVEIQCPDDCPYLHGQHDPKWRSETQQKEDALFLAPLFQLDEAKAAFALFWHQVLFRAGELFQLGSDREVVDSLGAVVKTEETRKKGVLYTHQSASPHLQRVTEWMLLVLEQLATIENAPQVAEGDRLEALKAMLAGAEAYARRASGRESYLEAAARLLGPGFKDAPPLKLPEASGEGGPLIVSP